MIPDVAADSVIALSSQGNASASSRAARAGSEKRSTASAAAPVLVMNPYYTGLGIARCLHGSGVDVHALCSEPGVPGAHSRYFESVYSVPNGRDNPEGLCRRLLEIRAQHPHDPIIFPTRDFDVLFLHDYRERLAPHFALPQPHESPIVRMMDKFELASVATRLGLATPLTQLCRAGDDLDRLMATLEFPVIVKPRFAYQWRGKGDWERVGSQKAIIVENAETFHALYPRLTSVAHELLIQQYVPGDDTDIVVCCCYIARDGELNGHFTGRKIRQVPPLIGTGSIVEATEIAAIVDPTVALLKAFGYCGIAEVEYKYSKRSDTYYLIEINPRHWDQHELGTLVGVNISRLAHADMVGRRLPNATSRFAPGVKYQWIAEAELAQSIAHNFSRELDETDAGPMKRFAAAIERTWLDLKAVLAGNKVFALCRLRDPLPGILMAVGLVNQFALILAQRMKRGSRRVDRGSSEAGRGIDSDGSAAPRRPGR